LRSAKSGKEAVMENEVLERLMKILELVSEESAELMNRYKEHEARVAQAEKRVEAINQSIEEAAKTIEGIGKSAKKCEKELLNDVRNLAQKCERVYNAETRGERIKSAVKKLALYSLVLALVVCAVVFFSARYFTPVAMEQYAEMKLFADRMKDMDSVVDRMTEKEREALIKMMSEVRKRSMKP